MTTQKRRRFTPLNIGITAGVVAAVLAGLHLIVNGYLLDWIVALHS